MTRVGRASFLGLALLVSGLGLLARASYVRTKGALGVALVERALTATLEDGVPRRPWPWAGMEPEARLKVRRLGVERAVLSNATGHALAFGLGRIPGTPVIAGHRDSWGAFLAELRDGDEVLLDASAGRTVFRVAGMRVARADDTTVTRLASEDALVLVTCWPFRGWLHPPWRYVVTCVRARGA